jgi:hypothetical protein
MFLKLKIKSNIVIGKNMCAFEGHNEEKGAYDTQKGKFVANEEIAEENVPI